MADPDTEAGAGSGDPAPRTRGSAVCYHKLISIAGFNGPMNLAPVTIKGVCIDAQGRVLLCRNHRLEWELPGGRPAPGEAFEACLGREIRDERGLAASVRSLVAAYPFEVLPAQWVNVIVYGCEIAPVGSQSPAPSTTTSR